MSGTDGRERVIMSSIRLRLEMKTPDPWSSLRLSDPVLSGNMQSHEQTEAAARREVCASHRNTERAPNLLLQMDSLALCYVYHKALNKHVLHLFLVTTATGPRPIRVAA